MALNVPGGDGGDKDWRSRVTACTGNRHGAREIAWYLRGSQGSNEARDQKGRPGLISQRLTAPGKA